MNAEQIHDAAQAIAGMRPHQTERSRSVKAGNFIKAGGSARQQIDLIKDQRKLIDEVKGLLPGTVSDERAMEWMDKNIPDWRLGPAPRGRKRVMEVADAD